MALKTWVKPLAVTILLTSGLALVGSWHGLAYQQTRAQQQAAVQYQQQLVAHAEYQTWLEGVQAMQPWLSLLQQDTTTDDWLTALTKWQQAHQQAWPDLELTQSQPAYNWQRFQLHKQLRIKDLTDYQAWLAWQADPFHPGLLPVQCRWLSQGHRLKVDQPSQAFKGTIDCTWQLDVWLRLSGSEHAISVSPQALQDDDIYQAFVPDTPTASLVKFSQAATTAHVSATPIPAAVFSGVVADGQQQYVNIDNVWSKLPMKWCHWQIKHYDGYALWLSSSEVSNMPQPIPLGQPLPNCTRD